MGAITCQKHPYLERKQIKGNCSRTYNGSLVGAAYKDGRLTSLQFIWEDGQKRFLTGGEIAGAYVRWVRIPR